MRRNYLKLCMLHSFDLNPRTPNPKPGTPNPEYLNPRLQIPKPELKTLSPKT